MKFNIFMIFFVLILSLVLSIDTTTTALATEKNEPAEATIPSDKTTTEKSDETTTTVSSGDGEAKNTESPGETTTKLTEESTTTSTTTITTTQKPSFAENIDASTQNFLGIGCMVNAVYNIEDVTSNFEFEMDLCGSKVNRGALSIFKEIKNLKRFNEKLENANDKICKNKNFSLDKDAERIPSAKCVKNIKNAILKLNETLKKTITKVNAYQKETTSTCAKISLLKFELQLNNFDAAIAECALVAAA